MNFLAIFLNLKFLLACSIRNLVNYKPYGCKLNLINLPNIRFGKINNMKTTTLILFFIITISLLSCKKTEHADLAIQNVTIIDATGAAAKSGMTVLIHGNQILKIDKTDKIKLADDVKVVDGSRKFLIPGLWDMHVHPYVEDKPIDVIGREFISIFIANGITNVRVMLGSSNHQMSDEITAGNLIGPRMIIASPLAAGPAPGRSNTYGISTVEKGRQFVQKSYTDGADFIKIGSYLSHDVYFAIANEVKKLGIPFAGHLPYSVKGIEAADAGQHSLEHKYSILIPCSNLEDEITTNLMNVIPSNRNRLKLYANIEYNEQKAKKFFTHLLENGTYVCPTIVVWDEFSKRNKEELTSDPRFNYMPSDIRENWIRTYENFADEGIKADLRKMNSKTRYIIGEMNKVGIKIIAGTDNGIPYVFPGLVYIMNLSYW